VPLQVLRLLAAIMPHPLPQAAEQYRLMLELVIQVAYTSVTLNEEAVVLALATLTGADTTGSVSPRGEASRGAERGCLGFFGGRGWGWGGGTVHCLQEPVSPAVVL
jgi:hypothetical protein